MAWVIDTSAVVDLITGDPLFEPTSTACLQNHLHDGLVISPVTFVELGPWFSGDDAAAEAFLKSAHIGASEFWSPADTLLAHRLWHQFQQRRRQMQVAKRPVADVLIAAFAERFQGIITRNAADFRNILPTLRIIEP
ncbi:MAG: type II toxin-antitoxin system VapC family toxin [Verrucomicrobiaceae bacterium]|jgi:predicted nucleic acid-binding protein|nr:type II toxin-antitoxin system VapC family toxin [Verrucomicrobiaceae bacterium]